MKIAAIQFSSSTDVDANLRVAEAAMERVSKQGAELVVLPENIAVYGADYRAVAEARGPSLMDWAAGQARQHGIWLVAGTLPLVTRPDGVTVAGKRVRASSLAFNPDGELVARYDKLHLFDAEVGDAQGRYCESDSFEPGDRLACVDAGEFRVGLAVCYDLRFAALSTALAERGAGLLLYPSAFTALTGEAHWEALLRARAIENGCYVLGVNQCGKHGARRESHGHSMLVDPWGRVLDKLENAPGELICEIDASMVEDVRRRLPVLNHRRFRTGLPDDIQDC